MERLRCLLSLLLLCLHGISSRMDANHDLPGPIGNRISGERRLCDDEYLSHDIHARFCAHSTRSAHQTAARRSRSAFAITETELSDIAPAASIGLSKIPNAGYSAPAAIGTPAAL